MDQTNLKLEHEYETIIIGGGINGAGIFRDLSLHGQKVLLLEKGDFSSQTSQGSSKMLHGGIRYLETLDFGLIHEALTEKNLWLKLAPHLAYEERFYMPVYKESKYPLWMLKLGLFLYDLLSFFKNTPYSSAGPQAMLKKFPSLRMKGLFGAGIYSDAIIDDAKLTLECIYDGMQSSLAHALNYTEVQSIETLPNGKILVRAQDAISKKHYSFLCRDVAIACGPFTDQVMKKWNIPWENIILPSKGSHLWVDKNALPLTSPMVLQTKDGRIIFLIPQRGVVLVGTTEVAMDPNENFFNLKPSAQEIEYLLNAINEYFPSLNIGYEHIISSFAAVRPLVREPNNRNPHKTSRKHKVISPIPNIYVIVGGKYTTFRKMAQSLVMEMFRIKKYKYHKDLTLKPLRYKSHIINAQKLKITDQDIKNILKNEMARTKEDIIKRRFSLQAESQLSEESKKTLNDLTLP